MNRGRRGGSTLLLFDQIGEDIGRSGLVGGGSEGADGTAVERRTRATHRRYRRTILITLSIIIIGGCAVSFQTPVEWLHLSFWTGVVVAVYSLEGFSWLRVDGNRENGTSRFHQATFCFIPRPT